MSGITKENQEKKQITRQNGNDVAKNGRIKKRKITANLLQFKIALSIIYYNVC